VSVHAEATGQLISQAATADIIKLESILDQDDAAMVEQIAALDEIPMMHGSGITRRLLVTAARQQTLPVMALCLYAAEGGKLDWMAIA
jgi:hypothetical protein